MAVRGVLAGEGVAPAATARHFVWTWLLVVVVVLTAGLRFNDGSMLLAIARNATITDPAFASSGSRYVWDSPLKVFVLREIIPANIMAVAAFFLALALLPLSGLLARGERVRRLTAVVLLLTPALKISLQNIGVGDGLVLALTMVLCSAESPILGGLALGTLLLWNPQQACVIAGSHLVARHCYDGRLKRDVWLTTAAALLAGGALYSLYRAMLGFSYEGRLAYLVSMYPRFASRNVMYALVAFSPICAWFAFARATPTRAPALLIGWLLACAGISWLTTDVTRVMTLISLPMICTAVMSSSSFERGLQPQRTVAWALSIALIPAYSWSGLDLFVWGDLLADSCKWASVCY